jgi:RHS repeat-associated protein
MIRDRRIWTIVGFFALALTVRAQTPPPIYTFTVPSGGMGYDGAGNLKAYTDSVTGTWSMQYDNLNRLQNAASTAGAYNGLGIQWEYDSFGNRKSQTPSGSAADVPPRTTMQYDDGSNRITSSSIPGVDSNAYDSSGNLKFDGNNGIRYDAENRVCAVRNQFGTITQYLYNAEGQRVAKGYSRAGEGLICPTLSDFVPTEKYILGPSGEQITTLNQVSGADVWQNTNVYANGELIATYDQEGSHQPLHFQSSDLLGTRRVQTSASGAAELYFSNLPYGDGFTSTGSGQDATSHHFTGKERDDESKLDYFGARYYGSLMGRFTSPDSSGYSGLSKPQSWNLYAYSLNNPLRYIDPDGHTVECKTGAADCLAAAQDAIGKDAAKQLTTKTVTTQNLWQKIVGGSTTTTTLQISGNEADFRSGSGNASKLADLIDSSTNFQVSIQQTGDPSFSSVLGSIMGGGAKYDLQGGAVTYSPSQGYNPSVFLDPSSAAAVDTDAARDHIPPASLGEKFAHELLGHEWGEVFGGHPNGTAANKRDAINSENEVRKTDPSRGQKTRHHD